MRKSFISKNLPIRCRRVYTEHYGDFITTKKEGVKATHVGVTYTDIICSYFGNVTYNYVDNHYSIEHRKEGVLGKNMSIETTLIDNLTKKKLCKIGHKAEIEGNDEDVINPNSDTKYDDTLLRMFDADNDLIIKRRNDMLLNELDNTEINGG